MQANKIVKSSASAVRATQLWMSLHENLQLLNHSQKLIFDFHLLSSY